MECGEWLCKTATEDKQQGRCEERPVHEQHRGTLASETGREQKEEEEEEEERSELEKKEEEKNEK